MLQIGDRFPEFRLSDQHGKERTLNDFAGIQLVVFFYPKDDTPGCTLEACDFQSHSAAFEEAVIIGVSPDGEVSHKRFAEKFGLKFTLLSDVEHSLAESCGVWVEKTLYGKKYMGIERTTYLCDGNHFIHRIWRKVKPEGHVEEVLKAI